MQSNNIKGRKKCISFVLFVVQTLSVTIGLCQLLSGSGRGIRHCCVNYLDQNHHHNYNDGSLKAFPSSSNGSCLLPISFYRYFHQYQYKNSLSIFVSALNTEDENLSKISLQARNRRRKLFSKSLQDHYQKYLNVDEVLEDEGGNGAVGDLSEKKLRQQKRQNQEECLYHTNMNTMDGDMVIGLKPIIVTKFCPGHSLVKLKFTRQFKDDINSSKAATQTLLVNWKEYIVEEMHSLGSYLDRLIY